MKTLTSTLALIAAVSATLSLSAIADPVPAATGGISTNTDHPVKAPAEGTSAQSSAAQLNSASPTGETKNMAPVRGTPTEAEKAAAPKTETSSASGLTAPGASSGSSLGSGSNSTLGGSVSETPKK